MKATLSGRINRLIGQLEGIKKMMDGQPQACEDVAIQFKAARSAMDSIFRDFLHTHACACKDPEKLKNMLDMLIKS